MIFLFCVNTFMRVRQAGICLCDEVGNVCKHIVSRLLHQLSPRDPKGWFHKESAARALYNRGVFLLRVGQSNSTSESDLWFHLPYGDLNKMTFAGLLLDITACYEDIVILHMVRGRRPCSLWAALHGRHWNIGSEIEVWQLASDTVWNPRFVPGLEIKVDLFKPKMSFNVFHGAASDIERKIPIVPIADVGDSEELSGSGSSMDEGVILGAVVKAAEDIWALIPSESSTSESSSDSDSSEDSSTEPEACAHDLPSRAARGENDRIFEGRLFTGLRRARALAFEGFSRKCATCALDKDCWFVGATGRVYMTSAECRRRLLTWEACCPGVEALHAAVEAKRQLSNFAE